MGLSPNQTAPPFIQPITIIDWRNEDPVSTLYLGQITN